MSATTFFEVLKIEMEKYGLKAYVYTASMTISFAPGVDDLSFNVESNDGEELRWRPESSSTVWCAEGPKIINIADPDDFDEIFLEVMEWLARARADIGNQMETLVSQDAITQCAMDKLSIELLRNKK